MGSKRRGLLRRADIAKNKSKKSTRHTRGLTQEVKVVSVSKHPAQLLQRRNHEPTRLDTQCQGELLLLLLLFHGRNTHVEVKTCSGGGIVIVYEAVELRSGAGPHRLLGPLIIIEPSISRLALVCNPTGWQISRHFVTTCGAISPVVLT